MKDTKPKFSCRRIGIILLIGFAAGVCIEMFRRSKRPAPAPAAVQKEGYHKIEEIVARVEPTRFGQTSRGQTIIKQIRKMLREGTIVFTHQVKPVGLFRTETFGPRTMYVKVLKNNSLFSHVPDGQIAGAIFHESIHAIQGGESSIEEECDGYAAGLVAQHIILEEEIPKPLLIDGKPAAIFIKAQYSELDHEPGYIPVGESPGWLAEMVGLSQ